MLRSVLLIVALMALNACAGVNSFDRPPKVIGAGMWQSEHFRRSHPDLVHRLAGQAHFEDGDLDAARAEFALAAGFGDKLSQAMLGEIYWEGHGVKADRSLAYAWMAARRRARLAERLELTTQGNIPPLTWQEPYVGTYAAHQANVLLWHALHGEAVSVRA